jgi:hypothetical protein
MSGTAKGLVVLGHFTVNPSVQQSFIVSLKRTTSPASAPWPFDRGILIDADNSAPTSLAYDSYKNTVLGTFMARPFGTDPLEMSSSAASPCRGILVETNLNASNTFVIETSNELGVNEGTAWSVLVDVYGKAFVGGGFLQSLTFGGKSTLAVGNLRESYVARLSSFARNRTLLSKTRVVVVNPGVSDGGGGSSSKSSSILGIATGNASPGGIVTVVVQGIAVVPQTLIPGKTYFAGNPLDYFNFTNPKIGLALSSNEILLRLE